jgi:hypothetical protein
MGCGDDCPYVPGLRRADWPLTDPKGKGIEFVRTIRDDIEARVKSLIGREELWASSQFDKRLDFYCSSVCGCVATFEECDSYHQ